MDWEQPRKNAGRGRASLARVSFVLSLLRLRPSPAPPMMGRRRRRRSMPPRPMRPARPVRPMPMEPPRSMGPAMMAPIKMPRPSRPAPMMRRPMGRRRRPVIAPPTRRKLNLVQLHPSLRGGRAGQAGKAHNASHQNRQNELRPLQHHNDLLAMKEKSLGKVSRASRGIFFGAEPPYRCDGLWVGGGTSRPGLPGLWGSPWKLCRGAWGSWGAWTCFGPCSRGSGAGCGAGPPGRGS